MAKARLISAYVWDCENCGRENFCRGVFVEFSPEDEQQMRERYEVDEWVTGDWVSIPDEVTCQHCGAEFETEDDRDDDV